jgi:ribosomal protein L11 methyltransferase
MAWLSVSFELPADHVDALSDALLEAGAASVDVADAGAGAAAEEAVFAEAGVAAPRFWRRSVMSALVARGVDAAVLVETACARAGIAPPAWRVREVADEDWVRASRDQLAPVRISARLWIVPSWHEAPEPGAVNIVLDPGLAFGTGHHPTTRMCLRWLERLVRGGETVLDFGSGSGILAIAAMKLGAARADGVDIDEQALLAARRNAMHNRVQATFHSAADTLPMPCGSRPASWSPTFSRVLSSCSRHCSRGSPRSTGGLRWRACSRSRRARCAPPMGRGSTSRRPQRTQAGRS